MEDSLEPLRLVVPDTGERSWIIDSQSPPPRVLVVDDEALIRWSICETLSDLGCAVLEAGDGETALRMLMDTAPGVDVIVLDYRLPDSDGLGLLSAIRRLAPGSQVIMMSAYGAPEMASGALALGVFRVMNKPFEMREIAAAVQEAHPGHWH